MSAVPAVGAGTTSSTIERVKDDGDGSGALAQMAWLVQALGGHSV